MSSLKRPALPRILRRQLLQMLDQMEGRLAAADPRRGAGIGSGGNYIRRLAASAAGLALVVVGVPMLVLPGPGVLSILLGLSLLAGQFPWARRLLSGVTSWARQRVAALPAGEATS